MRLTHHTSPTRSFLIIMIVVLATVYTALTLIHLQWKLEQIAQQKHNMSMPKGNLDTGSWVQYLDKNYPLNLLVPTNWQIYSSEVNGDFYVVHLDPPGKSGSIDIYVSNKGFAGIANPSGTNFYNSSKNIVTEYQDGIFLIKTKEFYYTFDAISATNFHKELLEIVRTARFE